MSSTEAECYAPRCLNPRLKKKGACCKSCPDGENCLLPNGTVLMATDVVQVGNAVCRCPKIQTGLGWNDDLRNAVCRVTTTPAPTTTTPVPSCRLPEEGGEKGKGGEEEEEEGKEESRVVVLEPGKEKIVPKEENCRKYVCDARGQLTTYYGQCPELNCTDATREPGDCCKTCPDDADASSSPTSYVTKPPPRVNSFFFSILNFIRLLFFGNTSPSPSTSKTHHHHHHHRHHRRHHHGSKAKTGSDASTGSGNRKEAAQQPRRWSFFTFFHG
ncbi:uncharacterized protein LOC143276559 isoform X2 [Babylonia areolata]|uniref:uncharacterized protein LOC143276559 isoform X2 n=1 Tax=Babylonia areolata TaxID=304850 RepID=UPI003FCFD12A